MTRFIAKLLAKYFGPKMAIQYAGTLITYLQVNILAIITGWGIHGAESEVEMFVKGGVGLLVSGLTFFFTTKFDIKEAEKRPDVPVIPSGKN